QQSSVATTG
ncbi:transposase, partial [Burkholderia stabilis]